MVLAGASAAALLTIVHDFPAFIESSRSELHPPMVNANAALLTELEHDPIRLEFLAHES